MNDDTVLRQIAREFIAKGVLPDHPPEQTWGGPGTGVKCALCAATVAKDELEFEVDFGRERYHMHLACFSAWDTERKTHGKNPRSGATEDLAEPHHVSARRPSPLSSPLSSDAAHVLPDPHGDGNIVVNGGERSYKPGAA